jgi:hypothetical protein
VIARESGVKILPLPFPVRCVQLNKTEICNPEKVNAIRVAFEETRGWPQSRSLASGEAVEKYRIRTIPTRAIFVRGRA